MSLKESSNRNMWYWIRTKSIHFSLPLPLCLPLSLSVSLLALRLNAVDIEGTVMQKLGDLRKDRKAGAEIMQPRYSEAQPWPSAGEMRGRREKLGDWSWSKKPKPRQDAWSCHRDPCCPHAHSRRSGPSLQRACCLSCLTSLHILALNPDHLLQLEGDCSMQPKRAGVTPLIIYKIKLTTGKIPFSANSKVTVAFF